VHSPPGASSGSLCAVVLLHGTRVLLREHEVGDLEGVLEYAADPRVARYVPWEPNTPDTARRFIDQAMHAASELTRSSYVLAVVERESGQVIGAARIGVEREAHRRADIGYVFRSDRWGEGFATEAVRVLVDFGFRDLDLYRIWATTHPDNRASSRVLEKVGMKYEGRIRGHMFVKGAWRDSLAYSVLRPEWSVD
jgi:ribosomal-protein-alanine N-acetyltransferase